MQPDAMQPDAMQANSTYTDASAAATAAARDTQWIKRESRVEVSVAAGVCVKRYFVPRHLRWRTIGRRSRAHREFDNLEHMRGLGLPVVRPLEWRDEWASGLNVSSELRTEMECGTRTLREHLAAPSCSSEIASALGRSLRKIHDAGFICNTASPRNWLVTEREDVKAVLCDLPNVVRGGRRIYASRWSFVDLYSAFLGNSRRRQSSAAWRDAAMDAYCAGDAAMARALAERVSAWSSRRFSMERELGIARGYLRDSFKGRIAPNRAR